MGLKGWGGVKGRKGRQKQQEQTGHVWGLTGNPPPSFPPSPRTWLEVGLNSHPPPGQGSGRACTMAATDVSRSRTTSDVRQPIAPKPELTAPDQSSTTIARAPCTESAQNRSRPAAKVGDQSRPATTYLVTRLYTRTQQHCRILRRQTSPLPALVVAISLPRRAAAPY